LEKKSVLKSGLKWNTLLAFSTAFFKFIRGFIVPKLLVLPEMYGLFTSIGVYQRYLNYADFGATAYLLKQYPRLYHNKESVLADELLNTVLNFFIISLAISSIVLFVLFKAYNGINSDFYRISFLLLIPITIVVNVRTLFSNLAAITYNYKNNSKISIVNDIASFIFVVIGINLKGAVGGVFGILLAEITNLLYSIIIIKPVIKFSFSFSWMKLFPHFFKQLLVGLVELVAGTFDVFIILFFFTRDLFGYYSLALAFSWGMIAISSIITTTLMPKVMALSYRDKHLISALSYKSILIYLLICFVVFIPVSFILLFLINVYFTHYHFSIFLIFIVLFSGVLRGLNSIQKANVLAYDRENKYIMRAIFIFLIYFIVAFIFHYLKLDFLKYIYLISLTDIIYTIALIFKAGPQYNFKESLKIVKALTVFIIIVYTIQFSMPYLPIGYKFYILFIAILLGIFCGLFTFRRKLTVFINSIINY
jgi:O-antigen/teichoic acid export membrane protein